MEKMDGTYIGVPAYMSGLPVSAAWSTEAGRVEFELPKYREFPSLALLCSVPVPRLYF